MKKKIGLGEISLGGVLIFAQLLLLTFLPDELKMSAITLIVMTTIALVVALFLPRNKEGNMFSSKFGKDFPKFIIATIITLIILGLIDFAINGSVTHAVMQAVAKYGLTMLLLLALVVALDEEIIFRWVCVDMLRSAKIPKILVWIIQAFVFALFHVAIKGNFMIAMLQFPLGLIYMWAKERFTPTSNMANIGVHFAWDLFVLGFTA